LNKNNNVNNSRNHSNNKYITGWLYVGKIGQIHEWPIKCSLLMLVWRIPNNAWKAYKVVMCHPSILNFWFASQGLCGNDM
jgi:hypothetical protein